MSRLVPVFLTTAQEKWARWAVEPMADFWAEQVADGEADHVPVLPEVRGVDLFVPIDEPDVIEDFLYRLEEQAPDLAEQHPHAWSSIALHAIRSAPLALAEKIRKAVRQ